MNIEEIIEKLPDNAKLGVNPTITINKNAFDEPVGAFVKCDDVYSALMLKALVARLREAEHRNELANFVDVDEDGIFNIHRDGKLIGYGGTVRDAIDSAVGFELHLSENKNGNS